MSTVSYHSKCILLLVWVTLSGHVSMGQSSREHLKHGNTEYRSGKFTESETSYRKALESATSDDSYSGTYNLGNSLYRLKKSEEAIQQYKNAIALTQDPVQKSKNLHNMGNTYMNLEQYQEAVDAYKQSLRLNPNDEDTRYNLAYAQSKLIQQQQQQQQSKDQKQDGDKKEKSSGNSQQNQQQQDRKDNQNQQKNKDGSEEQAENRDSQGDDKKQERNQKPGEGQPKRGMSKEEAERMLKALQNDEADLQKQMKRIEGKSIKTDKQW